MHRSVLVLLILIAMLWQAAAQSGPGAIAPVLADPEHAALHWQEEGHHHHDDGSFHLDDSQASTLHILSDHVTASVALSPALPHTFARIPSERPGGLQHRRVPAPFLDGLLRPPRRHA